MVNTRFGCGGCWGRGREKEKGRREGRGVGMLFVGFFFFFLCCRFFSLFISIPVDGFYWVLEAIGVWAFYRIHPHPPPPPFQKISYSNQLTTPI